MERDSLSRVRSFRASTLMYNLRWLAQRSVGDEMRAPFMTGKKGDIVAQQTDRRAKLLNGVRSHAGKNVLTHTVLPFSFWRIQIVPAKDNVGKKSQRGGKRLLPVYYTFLLFPRLCLKVGKMYLPYFRFF